MTEAIPFHVTCLLSVILLALFKTDTYNNIASVGFGNDIATFFIGVLVLSAFITTSGLGKRGTLPHFFLGHPFFPMKTGECP